MNTFATSALPQWFWRLAQSVAALAVIAAVLPLRTEAATSISGSITADTVWDVNGSPYTITGDTTLFPGYTLTIDSGVQVLVVPSVDTEIRGQLKINGTAEQPVTLTATDTTAKWNGLYINTTQGGGIQATYAHVSYALQGIDIACCNTGGPLIVADSEFTYNELAIGGYAGSVRMRIERTLFDSNTVAINEADKDIYYSEFRNNGYGLNGTERVNVYNSVFAKNSVAVNGGRGELKCSIIKNNTTGVQAYYEGMALSYSDVTDNGTGIILPTEGASPALQYNNIYNNSLNVQTKSDSNQDATLNWWNSVDAGVIQATITDGLDDPKLGLVDIDPWQTAAVDTVTYCGEQGDGDVEENPLAITVTEATYKMVVGKVTGPIKITAHGKIAVTIKVYRDGKVIGVAKRVVLTDAADQAALDAAIDSGATSVILNEAAYSKTFPKLLRHRIRRSLKAGADIQYEVTVKDANGNHVSSLSDSVVQPE